MFHQLSQFRPFHKKTKLNPFSELPSRCSARTTSSTGSRSTSDRPSPSPRAAVGVVAAAAGEATNEAEVTEDAEDQAEEGAVTTDTRCPCYTTFLWMQPRT